MELHCKQFYPSLEDGDEMIEIRVEATIFSSGVWG